MWIAEGYHPFKESDLAKIPKIAKGYRPLKLISPVQQQTEMAKALVKRKNENKKSKGIRKPVQKNNKVRPVQRKVGNKKIPTKSGGKNRVRRVKQSIKGRRMVPKDIFS